MNKNVKLKDQEKSAIVTAARIAKGLNTPFWKDVETELNRLLPEQKVEPRSLAGAQKHTI